MSSVLTLIAILPAAVLLFVIYKVDNIEKEPLSLMAKVFGLGALTVISAIIMELVGETILSVLLPGNTVLYVFLEMFCVVAFSEELGKFVVLKWATWNNPEFNFSFDGIVYSVCATLGFATVENIKYVYYYGLDTALTRCITAVPGHCIFGIFMGIYYGMAKACEARGNETGKKLNLRKALIIPILLHGFYDFSCSINSQMLLVFFVFEIIITVSAIRMVIKMSKTDMPLQPEMNQMIRNQSMNQMGQNQTIDQTNGIYQTPVTPVQQQPQQVVTPVVNEPVQSNAPYNPNPVFTAESIDPKFRQK